MAIYYNAILTYYYVNVHLFIQSLFLNATAVDWKVGEAIAGQVMSGGGLSFITIEGAGHQVPMDQPANVSCITS